MKHDKEKYQLPDIESELMIPHTIVIDLNKFSIEELHNHETIGIYECLMKKSTEDTFFKYITEEDTEYIPKSFKKMPKYLKKASIEFIVACLQKKPEDKMSTQEMIEKLTQVFNKDKEIIMSLIESIQQEEKLDIAKNMLHEGAEPSFIKRVTGLPMKSIRELQIT